VRTVAKPYTYQIDRRVNDEWVRDAAAEDRTVEDRPAIEVARAILEDWIIDNPGRLVGGGRVTVFDEDPFGEAPEENARVRVFIYFGTLDDRAAQPSASAYLLSDPDLEDPHGWVNP
jgi:hypothetical protein